MNESFEQWKERRDSGCISLEVACVSDIMQELILRKESVLIYVPNHETQELKTYTSLPHDAMVFARVVKPLGG